MRIGIEIQRHTECVTNLDNLDRVKIFVTIFEKYRDPWRPPFLWKDWQGFLSGFARIDPSGASVRAPGGKNSSIGKFKIKSKIPSHPVWSRNPGNSTPSGFC